MGTNYYVRPFSCDDACAHCDLKQEIHIGKASAGWQFLHRAYLEDSWRELPAVDEKLGCEIRDRKTWLAMLELGQIYDEYGQLISRARLLKNIDAAKLGRASIDYGEYFDGPYWFNAREFS